MKTITVKAIFRGQNGSCGYETNKEYSLLIEHISFSSIQIENIHSVTYKDGINGYCEYGSVISFLENWDNIRRI